MASSAGCASSYCSRIFLTYEPSLAGNAIFLAVFAVLIPVTFALGIKYKSSIFAATLNTGLALEVVGYIGRVLLHSSPNDRSYFILFLIGTVIGPTFICAAMFLVMPQIVTVYGDEFRSWRPGWYSYLFYALSTVSVVLELVGGILSTIRDDSGDIDTGVPILIAGLAIQLFALAIFIFHAILFAIAVRTRHHALDIKFAGIYNSGSFKIFLLAFSLATLLLVVRTAYRLVVVAEGYGSSIAQSEILFLVLDGLMVLLASLLLLVFFPGRVLPDSQPQTMTRRISKTPLRPIRPAPYESPSTHHSPTYNPSSVRSSQHNYSPRKMQYPVQPPPQGGMVDSDALW
ncbi:RTA1-domain-containing protein [Annulohypoxylon maeteangense]|uniref:RTA1-domain-containing protein n=1 Tax=Annulohypoxylon maeteangense TaxID=1927788 RepID=UPI002008151F|nr:RTA1-domain-containing protein [Annulohypoxylon maeteangense]KAI0881831.1 RTA1-domain-containing protein [Annulohypoxylon maeteangense]